MSLNRLKSQEKGTDAQFDQPERLLSAHQNFIISLLRTLKIITSDNKQYSKNIKQLTDEYKKAMNDILTSGQNLDSDPTDQTRLRSNNNETPPNQIIRQIRSDLSDLRLKFEILSLDFSEKSNEPSNDILITQKNIQKLSKKLALYEEKNTNKNTKLYSDIKTLTEFCKKQGEEISLIKNSIKTLNQDASTDDISQDSKNNLDDFVKKMIVLQKKINDMPQIKSDVDKIMTEIEAIKQNAETLKQEIDDKNSFESKIQNQNQQITKIKKMINYLNDKISKKSEESPSTSDLENIKKELTNIKDEIQKENESKLNEIKESISSAKSTEIAHIKKTLTVLIKDYNASKATNTSFCSETTLTINDLKKRFDLLESANSNQVQTRDIQLENDQKLNNDLSEQIQDIQNKFNESIQSLNDSNIKLKSEIKEIKKQMVSSDVINQQIQDLKAEFNQKFDQIQPSNESEIKKLQDDRDEDSQKVKDELNEKISSLKKEIMNEINQVSSSVNEQITKLQNEAESLNNEQQTISQRIDEIETNIDKNNKQRDEEIDLIKTDIKCVKYEVKKSKHNYAIHSKPDNVNDDSISEVKKDLSQMKEQVNSLFDLSNHTKEQNAVLNLIKEEMKELINSSNQISKEFDQSIRCIKDEIKKLKAGQLINENLKKQIADEIMKDYESIDVIESNIRNLKSRIFELNRSTRCLKFELKRNKERQNKIEELVNSTEILNNISDLKKQVSELQENSKHNDLIETLKEDVDDLKKSSFMIEDMPDIEKKISLAKKELKKEVLDEIMNDGESTEVIESNIRNLKSRIFELNRSTRCLKYEIKHLKERQDEVEELVNSTEILNDISNLKQQASDLQDSTNELAQNNEKLNRLLRCVKYELKRLKESNDNLNNKEEERTIKERSAPIMTFNNSDIEDLRNQIKNLNDKQEEDIQNSLDKHDKILGCIKYELKKLKQESRATQEQQEAHNKTEENIQNSLDKHDKILGCIKYELKKLKQESKTTQEQQEAHKETEKNIQNSLDKHDKILGCIKYELKKLKQESKAAHEQQEEFANKVKSIETQNEGQQETVENIQNSLDNHNKILGCLKYELKKIKQESKAAQKQQEAHKETEENIQNSLDNHNKIISCLKYELKKLKQESKTAQKQHAELANKVKSIETQNDEQQETHNETKENIQNSLEDHNMALRCIKYELKKLQQETQNNKENLSEQISSIEKQVKSIESKNDEQEEIQEERSTTIQNTLDNHNKILGCIKYELKKLKQETKSSQEQQTELSNKIKSIETKNDEQQETHHETEENIQNTLDNHNKILGCIKYELKKLKQETKSSQEQHAELVDKVKSIETQNDEQQATQQSKEGTIQNSLEEHNMALRCIKYEIKKLKNNQDSLQSKEEERTVRERSAPIITFDDSYIEELKKQINTLYDKQEENQKQEQAHLSTEENIQHSLEEHYNTLRCIKYELKKLQKETQNNKENLSEQLSEITNQVKSIESKNDEQQEEQLERSTTIQNTLDNHNKILGCIKYELKKLKQETKSSQEQQTDLSNKIKSIETKNDEQEETHHETEATIQNSLEEHNMALRCIKHELKKLQQETQNNKENLSEQLSSIEKQVKSIETKNEEQQETQEERSTTIQNSLDKHDKILGCIKYELKKLKQKSKENQEQQTELSNKIKSIETQNDEQQATQQSKETTIQNSLEEHNMALRCIKYELKKLQQETQNNKENLSEQLSSIEKQVKSIENKNEEQEETRQETETNIQNILDNHNKILGCIKYELKKLKQETKSSQEQHAEFVDKVKSLEDKNDEQQETQQQFKENIQQTLESNNKTLRCLKYEVLQLKRTQTTLSNKEAERTIRERSAPIMTFNDSDIEELKKQINDLENKNNEQNATQEQQDEEFSNIIRCIKYELKKLQNEMTVTKEHQKETADILEKQEQVNKELQERQEARETTIQKSLDNHNKILGCIKYELKKLKQETKSSQEQQTELSNKVKSIETKNDKQEETHHETEASIRNSLEDHNMALRCMKYELKKLQKETQNNKENLTAQLSSITNQVKSIESKNEKQQETHKETETSIQNTLDNHNKILGCIKYELKKLKQETKSSQEQHTELSNKIKSIETKNDEQEETLHETEATIQNSLEEHNMALRCIKYELKKLQQETQNNKVNLSEQLSSIEKQVKSIENKNEEQEETQKERSTTIKNALDNHNKILGCIKYELKKLKQETKSSQEQQTELSNKIKSIETQNDEQQETQQSKEANIQNSLEDHNMILRCMKYELKKLQQETHNNKENLSEQLSEITNQVKSIETKNDKQQEEQLERSTTIQNTLDNHNKILGCIKYELKKLKQETKSSQEQQTELVDKIKSIETKNDEQEETHHETEATIQNSLEEHNMALRCMKYELKKLQQETIASKEQHAELVDKVKSIETQNEEQQETQKLKEVNIQQSLDKHHKILRCIKFELKNLKQSHENLSNKEEARCVKERSAPIMTYDDSDINEIKNQITALQNTQEESSKHDKSIEDTINCLKHELKKLHKEAKSTKEQLSQQQIEFENKLQNKETQNKEQEQKQNEINNEHKLKEDELFESLRCIKHELKKALNDNQRLNEQFSTQLSELENKVDNNEQANKKQQETHLDAEQNIQRSLDNHNKILGCIKYELKKLKHESKTAQEQHTKLASKVKSIETQNDEQQETQQSREANIQNSLEDHNMILRCIKYELKKLQQETHNNKENLSEQLSSIEKQVKSIENKNDEQEETQKERSTIIQNTLDNHNKILGCIKYELKKLKQETKSSQEQHAELVDKFKSLEDKNDEQQETQQQFKENIQQTLESNNKTLRCLKYEVLQLKRTQTTLSNKEAERTIRERSAPIMTFNDSDIEELKKQINDLENKNNEQNATQEQQDEEFSNIIRCIKYELKKLQNEITVTKEHQKETADILEKQEQVNKELQEQQEARETSIQKSLDNHNKILGCIKYELKKLKQETKSSQEQQTELSNKIKSIETQNDEQQETQQSKEATIQNSLEDHNMALRCIKHELKKLQQETQNNKENLSEQLSSIINQVKSIENKNDEQQETRQETETTIQNTLDNHNKILGCIKYELKKLKQETKSSQEQHAELSNKIKSIETQNDEQQTTQQSKEATIQNSLEEHNMALRCIKYELKKLQQETQNNKENLSEQLSSIEKQVKSIENKNEEQEETRQETETTIQNTLDNHNKILGCIKYELKKLKQETKSSQEQHAELSNKIKSIETQNDEQQTTQQSKEATIQNSLEEHNMALRCIKHELKKLQQETKSSQEQQEELIDKVKSIEDKNDEQQEMQQQFKENIQQTLESNNKTLRCIKYEVLQLKRTQTTLSNKEAERTIRERSAPIMTFNDSDIEELKKQINDLQTTNDELNKQITNLCDKQDESNEQQQTAEEKMQNALDQHNKILSCIKYELKKLKSKQETLEDKENTREIKERSAPVLSIGDSDIDEIKDQIASLCKNQEENNQHNNSIEESIRCLKHELKKLSNEAKTTKDELKQQQEEIENKLQERESQNLEFNQNQNEMNNEHKKKQDQLSSEINNLSDSLRCIKHELKKVVNDNQRFNEQFSEQLSELENKFDNNIQENKNQQAKQESKEENIQHSLDKHNKILRCIKFEVKKLKESHESLSNKEEERAVRERSAPIITYNNSDIDELKNQINDLQTMNQNLKDSIDEQKNIINDSIEEHGHEVDNTLRCIKHELKKLLNESILTKEHQEEIENKVKSIESENKGKQEEQQISDEKIQQSLDNHNKILGCIKYELKILKQETKSSQEQHAELVDKVKSLEDKNDEQQETQQQFKENIQQTLESNNKTLRCIKYEVLQLKRTQTNLSNKEAERTIRERSAPIMTFNDSDIEELKKQINDLENKNNKQNATQEQQDEEFSNIIRCIKHELKKLQHEFTITKEQQSNLVDKVESIETKNSEQQENQQKVEENIQYTLDQNNKALRCIKFELKNMKSLQNELTTKEESDIEDLKNQITTLSDKQQESLEDTVRSLKQEINECNEKESKDINDLHSIITPLNTQLTMLQADFQVTNFNVKKLGKAALQKPVHTLSQSTSEDFFELKKQLENQTRQLNDMKEDLTQSQLNFYVTPQVNNEEFEQLKKSMACMKHEFKKLITKQKQDIDQLQTEILPLKNQLTTLQADFQVTNFNVKKLTKAAAQKPTRTMAPTNDEDFFELKKQLEDQTRKLNDMKEDLTQSTNNFNITPNLNSESIEQLKKSMACMKHEFKKLITKQKQDIDQLQSSLKSNINELQTEILPLKNQLTTLQADFQVTNFNVKKLTKAAAQKPTRTMAPTNDEDFFELKKQLEDQTRQIKDIKEDLTQSTTNFNITPQISVEDFNKISKIITCLKYEIRKLKKSSINDNENVDVLEVKTRSIPTIENENDKEIESLKTEIENLKEQNKLRIEEETEKFESINTELRNLKSSFSNISADLQATQFKLKKIGTNNTAKKTTYVEGGPSSEEFFELEKKVSENQRELEDVKQNLSNLQEKIKVLNKYDDKLESIDQRLDEANLDELKDKINTLNAENTVIKSKIKQGILNEANPNDLQSTEVNKLKKQMKDINENIDDINRFVDAFKEKIISIEDKLPPSESSSASGSDDEDAIKTNAELISEIPKIKEDLNYHSFTISESVKGIRNLRETLKELTDQINKHTLTLEYYSKSISALKRGMNKINDNNLTHEKDTQNEAQNSDSASASASEEEHNDNENENDNADFNVTLNDDTLVDLEILKKEFAEFKTSSLESIKCLKHEVRKLIGTSNEKKKNEKTNSKRTSPHKENIFGEITNHQMLTKQQKEINCIKYELKKLILLARDNKMILSKNKHGNEEEKQNNNSDFEEEENDSKDNNKKEKISNDDRLDILRRVLKWNFVDDSPEVYIDKETKNHKVPSSVLPIISTLIDKEFFKSSSVDLSTFNSAMTIIKDEFPQIKMNSQDSRFICTYLVMNLVNSSKFKFEKERVDFFNQTFTPIMNIAAKMIILPFVPKFTLFINRFVTGSFEIEPLKKDFTKIMNSCVDELHLNYNSTINTYLQKVLFALIDQKIANRIISNPSRFDYESVNNWLEYVNSDQIIDFNITKQIVNCLNKSFEISNNSDLRNDLCPDLDDNQIVFLIKNYVPDPKLNSQKIDIDNLEYNFDFDESDSIKPITEINLPKIQSNDEFDNEIFRDLARKGMQKDLLQNFTFLSKYIDN